MQHVPYLRKALWILSYNKKVSLVAIRSKEYATTKKQAAQNVALSLVRQLFHMGAIEAAEKGQLQAKKLKSEEVRFFNWKFIITLALGNKSVKGIYINVVNGLLEFKKLKFICFYFTFVSYHFSCH